MKQTNCESFSESIRVSFFTKNYLSTTVINCDDVKNGHKTL